MYVGYDGDRIGWDRWKRIRRRGVEEETGVSMCVVGVRACVVWGLVCSV